MKTFLMVLAAVVVGVPLGLWLVWQLFKWKLNRLTSGLFDFDREPARINLIPADQEPRSREWPRHLTALRTIGFQSVGTFVARQRPGLHIHGLVDESRSMYGAVYSYRNKVHTDIVTLYPDGRIVTSTNMPLTGLDTPPWHTVHRLPGVPAADLVRQHLAERPGLSSHATEPRFARDFEATHVRLMEWRLLRGVTEDEARRVAEHDPKLKGKPLDESMIKATVTAARAKYDAELRQDLTERALEQAGYPPEEWESLIERTLVITTQTKPSEVVDMLLVFDRARKEGDHDEQAHARMILELSAGPIRETVRARVKSMTTDQPALLLSVETPLPGDVYLFSEAPDADSPDGEAKAEA